MNANLLLDISEWQVSGPPRLMLGYILIIIAFNIDNENLKLITNKWVNFWNLFEYISNFLIKLNGY